MFHALCAGCPAIGFQVLLVRGQIAVLPGNIIFNIEVKRRFGKNDFAVWDVDFAGADIGGQMIGDQQQRSRGEQDAGLRQVDVLA